MVALMTAELGPLFDNKLIISADEARAIVAALYAVAASDGVHDDERAMIDEFVAELDLELGDDHPADLEPVTPAELAEIVTAPELRKVAVQTAVMLAMADGAISDKERECVQDYAAALGFSRSEYDELESALVGWLRSGDLEPMFG